MSQYQYNKRDTAIHELYAWQKGIWKKVGWRCSLCDKTFKGESTMTKHLDVCKELNTTKKEKEMPIQVITVKGERYYRYGDTGKMYRTRQEAEKQAAAIHAAGYKESKDKDGSKSKS